MELYEYEKEHLKALRPHLAECTVLLKSNGDFPLARPCRIALYGSGARRTVKGGTGSGEVNSRCFVTAEQGLDCQSEGPLSERGEGRGEEKEGAGCAGGYGPGDAGA